mmetsp:Transcript_89785/g.225791  ORF Transcript_89785/g.225791 Transcript_89785/m.225791 type:complete len:183 (+) Transcript_89785:56-604(+)
MNGSARLSPHHNDYHLGRPSSPRREVSALARGAVPGYGGHRPTNMKDKSSPPASVCGDSMSDAGSMTSGSPARTKAISTRAAQPIPGYGGHVPGKHANGHFGKTFAQASFDAVTSHRAPPSPEIPLSPNQFHGRVNIPGYAGHMPGKVSDGQFGRSPIKAAKEGWLTEQRAKERGGGLVVLD